MKIISQLTVINHLALFTFLSIVITIQMMKSQNFNLKFILMKYFTINFISWTFCPELYHYYNTIHILLLFSFFGENYVSNEILTVLFFRNHIEVTVRAFMISGLHKGCWCDTHSPFYSWNYIRKSENVDMQYSFLFWFNTPSSNLSLKNTSLFNRHVRNFWSNRC